MHNCAVAEERMGSGGSYPFAASYQGAGSAAVVVKLGSVGNGQYQLRLTPKDDTQARLERMPGGRSRPPTTGRGAHFSYTQCVRDGPLAPATETDPSPCCSM